MAYSLGVKSGHLSSTIKQVRFQDPLVESRNNQNNSPGSLPRKSVMTYNTVNASKGTDMTNSSVPVSDIVAASLDLSVLDEPHLSNGLRALTLDAPQANTVKALQEEIIQLAGRVYVASNSVSLLSK